LELTFEFSTFYPSENRHFGTQTIQQQKILFRRKLFITIEKFGFFHITRYFFLFGDQHWKKKPQTNWLEKQSYFSTLKSEKVFFPTLHKLQ